MSEEDLRIKLREFRPYHEVNDAQRKNVIAELLQNIVKALPVRTSLQVHQRIDHPGIA